MNLFPTSLTYFLQAKTSCLLPKCSPTHITQRTADKNCIKLKA